MRASEAEGKKWLNEEVEESHPVAIEPMSPHHTGIKMDYLGNKLRKVKFAEARQIEVEIRAKKDRDKLARHKAYMMENQVKGKKFTFDHKGGVIYQKSINP